MLPDGIAFALDLFSAFGGEWLRHARAQNQIIVGRVQIASTSFLSSRLAELRFFLRVISS